MDEIFFATVRGSTPKERQLQQKTPWQGGKEALRCWLSDGRGWSVWLGK